MSDINERFVYTPQVVAQGCQQYSEGEAAEEVIANMNVDVPSHPPSGLAYRVTIAGTCATGTNGAMTIKIKLEDPESNVFLTFDGQVGLGITHEDAVIINKAPHTIRMIKPPGLRYYDLLKAKLRWSGR